MALLALAAPATAAEPVVIAAIGDSLTAGYGLAPEDSFPSQLERALRERGIEARVVNAGVSGDTTAGGVSRLEWILGDDPDYAILSLGANDMLRGLDPKATRANLDRMMARLAEKEIPVLLSGFLAAPNLGPDYQKAFDSIYPELAERYGAVLFPFFLQDVALERDLNQRDGLHPNAEGVARVVDNILPYVLELIGQDAAASEARSGNGPGKG